LGTVSIVSSYEPVLAMKRNEADSRSAASKSPIETCA
jgi:hypothetical protein